MSTLLPLIWSQSKIAFKNTILQIFRKHYVSGSWSCPLSSFITFECTLYFRYDTVNLFDGENDQATELGEFEGNLANMMEANGGSSVVKSTGNNIFIQLKSDDSFNTGGFRLQITRGMKRIFHVYMA